MKKLSISILICILFLTTSFHGMEPKGFKLKTIVIDAGHGGKDPGCLGFGSKEKDIALDVAIKLGEFIKQNMSDVKIIYTRKTDVFVELHERAAIANRNNADLFISVHVNSGPSGLYGTETFCMGLHKSEQNLEIAQRENSSILMEHNHEKEYDGFDPKSPQSYILFSLYQSAFMANSTRLAGKIEKEFEENNKRHSRGVKQAGFLVLWKTSMPSVLVETGFLTDTTDANYLKEEKGRVDTAWGIYSAIEDFKNEMEEGEE
ncbi:MAG TPA: N-acetylmuramoyl-L-alanine amidase [Cytophagaceae bacterium]|jgi:N-acetylmuramoyl-L-alanine amidase|nr:N-acetylmuramoyl-L-alanine amidase [Cytophagaceae bacterium]